MSQEQPSLSLAGKLAHRKALHASAQNGLSTTDRSFLCRVQSREKGGEEEPEAEPQGQEGGREKALPPTARKLPCLSQDQGRSEEDAKECHLYPSVQLQFY